MSRKNRSPEAPAAEFFIILRRGSFYPFHPGLWEFFEFAAGKAPLTIAPPKHPVGTIL